MWLRRAKLFFEKNKLLIVTAIILISLILIVFLLPKFGIKNKDIVTNHSILDSNLVSAFVGAILGSIFSLLGSTYVTKREIASQHNINRKNIIFIPIYDELIENKKEILVENPFPSFVSTIKGNQTIKPHPQYYTVNRIATDFRWLEVPKDLKSKISNLKDAITSYLLSFKNINEPIKNMINEILLEEFNQTTNISNIGEAIINEIADPDNNDGILKRYSLLISDKDITLDKITEIDRKIIHDGNNLDVIKDLIDKRKQWLKIQDEIVEYLELEIKLINEKYSI